MSVVGAGLGATTWILSGAALPNSVKSITLSVIRTGPIDRGATGVNGIGRGRISAHTRLTNLIRTLLIDLARPTGTVIHTDQATRTIRRKYAKTSQEALRSRVEALPPVRAVSTNADIRTTPALRNASVLVTTRSTRTAAIFSFRAAIPIDLTTSSTKAIRSTVVSSRTRLAGTAGGHLAHYQTHSPHTERGGVLRTVRVELAPWRGLFAIIVGAGRIGSSATDQHEND